MKLSTKFQVALGTVALFWVAYAALFYHAGAIFGEQNSISVERRVTVPNIPSVLETVQPMRPTYRFGLIPHGVVSVDGLHAEVNANPVLKKFFDSLGFDWSTARLASLGTPACVYMSFRIGNRIKWSQNCIALPADEAVIVDASGLAVRMACGNVFLFTPKPTPNYPAQPVTPSLLREPSPLPPIITADAPPARFEEIFPPTPPTDAPTDFIPAGGVCCFGGIDKPISTEEPNMFGALLILLGGLGVLSWSYRNRNHGSWVLALVLLTMAGTASAKERTGYGNPSAKLSPIDKAFVLHKHHHGHKTHTQLHGGKS